MNAHVLDAFQKCFFLLFFFYHLFEWRWFFGFAYIVFVL